MGRVILYRPARTYPELLSNDEFPLSVPPVNQSPQTGSSSWLQLLFPVVGSLGGLVFILISPNRTPFLFFGVGLVVLLSVGVSIGVRLQHHHAHKKQQKSQNKRYVQRLEEEKKQLEALKQKQRQVQTLLSPELSELSTVVATRERLWERRHTDSDFLEVRLGLGATPLCRRPSVKLVADEAEYDPALLATARGIASHYAHLDEMPVTVKLSKLGVCSVTGPTPLARALTRAMLCQIGVFHAPEDVRILVCYPSAAREEWEWLRWLPHTRRLRYMKREGQTGIDQLCLLAETNDDCQFLLEGQIFPELERRQKIKREQNEAATNRFTPHLLIILDDFKAESSLTHLPVLNTLFQHGKDLGVTILCLTEQRKMEPALLQARIEIRSPDGWLRYEETSPGGSRQEGILADRADGQFSEHIARKLAPLTLSEYGAQPDLSQDVRLLTLLALPSADAVALEERWKPRSLPDLLRVPIGILADGAPLLLDFKELADKGMGPHGLIVGTTGSGKSKLLQTIVSSVAITHSPDMVNFLLIDFKGGAAFAALSGLPHVAGMMTNLEQTPALIERILESLEGEILRRQQLLREAGNLENIKEYQAKRGNASQLPPLPYLLVIIDEFAELIKQQPEFLEQLKTIGKIGRSVGMYLLLATQTVDMAGIRGLDTHLRYRICLRTSNVQESASVLGGPEAFYLASVPGVGYFKVDADPPMLFKSAIISVPYVPVPERASPFLRIREFTKTGVLIPAAPVRKKAPVGAGERDSSEKVLTDMDRAMTLLAERYTARTSAPVHQVWLPPLKALLPLDKVFASCRVSALDGSRWPNTPALGALRIPLGQLDRPREQRQDPLILDLSGAGGHLAIAGAPQSGKSTLLRTLITSFLLTHSPRAVQFYCVDLGGGLLRILEHVPHVGAVCNITERDKILRLVRRMAALIEERTLSFPEYGIDSMAAYRAQRHAGELGTFPFGDIFLVIDDLAQFQTEFPQLDPELIKIVSTGLTYGVHLILTTQRWAFVRSSLLTNVGTRLELRLNDPQESDVSKQIAKALPRDIPGRGVTQEGFLFQTAVPGTSDKEGHALNPTLYLEALVRRARTAWNGPVAPPIRLLPPLVTWADLERARGAKRAGVPIGLEEFELEPIYLDLLTGEPHFIIFGDSESGKTTLLRALMRGLEQHYTPKQVRFAIVDSHRGLYDFATSPHLLMFAYTPQLVKDCVESFKKTLEERRALRAKASSQDLHKQKTWAGTQAFLVVDDYESLLGSTGNPLVPLVDFLPESRELGFHLVVTRRVGGTARTSLETVFQRLREMNAPGLIMNGDPQEGPLLLNQKAGPLPPGRGYLVRRNQQPTLVQVVFAEPPKEVE